MLFKNLCFFVFAGLVKLSALELASANPIERNLAYRSPFVDQPHVSIVNSVSSLFNKVDYNIALFFSC